MIIIIIASICINTVPGALLSDLQISNLISKQLWEEGAIIFPILQLEQLKQSLSALPKVTQLASEVTLWYNILITALSSSLKMKTRHKLLFPTNGSKSYKAS